MQRLQYQEPGRHLQPIMASDGLPELIVEIVRTAEQEAWGQLSPYRPITYRGTHAYYQMVQYGGERLRPLAWTYQEQDGQPRFIAPRELYPSGARLLFTHGRRKRSKLTTNKKGRLTRVLISNENGLYRAQRSLFDDPGRRSGGIKNLFVISEVGRHNTLQVHLAFAVDLSPAGRVLHCDELVTLWSGPLVEVAPTIDLPGSVQVEPEIGENFRGEEFGT